MWRWLVMVVLGGVAALPAAAQTTEAVATQNLKAKMQEHWETLTKSEQAVLAERARKYEEQTQDENRQKWYSLSEEEQQRLRVQREEEIRAQAQERLNQRRKGR